MTKAGVTRSFWDVPEPTTPEWREKRRLAAALRELVALCVTTEAPAPVLASAADAAAQIVQSLAEHPTRMFKDAYGSLRSMDELHVFADRGLLTGKSNPIAPPMEVAMEGETAIGFVTLGPAFEGVPGCAHGGIVAAVLDQIFGYLQSKLGVRSLTGSLTVRYHHTTPLLTRLRLEAKVDSVEGRRSFVRAHIAAGERVTASAEAIFVAVDAERLRSAIAHDAPSED